MESQVSYLGLHPEQEAVFMATCIRAVLAAEITNHAPPPPAQITGLNPVEVYFLLT